MIRILCEDLQSDGSPGKGSEFNLSWEKALLAKKSLFRRPIEDVPCELAGGFCSFIPKLKMKILIYLKPMHPSIETC